MTETNGIDRLHAGFKLFLPPGSVMVRTPPRGWLESGVVFGRFRQCPNFW